MDALDQSAALIRRGAELRDRSMQVCAAADEKVEKSWRLTAAAARARETIMRVRDREPAARRARATADGLPAGR